jgi:hypothetical protein
MRRSDIFQSKYFKASEFPDTPRVFEIETSRIERLENGDKTVNKLVLYFRGIKSGLVIGATVYDQIAEFLGDETDNWPGHNVECFRTETQFQNKTVPAIRVRKPGANSKAKPRKAKPEAKPDFNDEVSF